MSLTSHLAGGKRTLMPLREVERVSPVVVRVLGGNPGSYTLQGTSTYVVGTGPQRILVDAGDGSREAGYVERLRRALREAGAEGIETILATHWHHDHVNGIADVVEAFPHAKVFKHLPLEPDEVLAKGAGEGSVKPTWTEFRNVEDGDVLRTEGATLRMVHAPGHTRDMMVPLLEEEGSMFSSDNVLGQGTGVVAELEPYLASLRRMRELRPTALYPGHGPVIYGRDTSLELIRAYEHHRELRLNEALQAVRFDKWTPLAEAVKTIYGDTLPVELLGPAGKNVSVSLALLVKRGVVEKRPGGHDAHQYRRVSPKKL